MPEIEGVIKYRLEFSLGPAPDTDVEELNTWRNILYGLDLVGQHSDRYGGYGFGNLSMRDPESSGAFIITASQTGHLDHLTAEDYCRVGQVDFAAGRVVARGRQKPSSEALSHAMIYQLDSRLNSVLHVHDPGLWQFGLQHGYPASAVNVAYGTLAMAQELARLYRHADLQRQGILIMGGHEDGVMTFGDSIDQAGQRLLQLFVRQRAT